VVGIHAKVSLKGASYRSPPVFYFVLINTLAHRGETRCQLFDSPSRQAPRTSNKPTTGERASYGLASALISRYSSAAAGIRLSIRVPVVSEEHRS